MNGGYRPNSGRKKGSIPWNKGVPMREESKVRVSQSKKGTPAWNKGKPAPWAAANGFKKGRVSNWKGKSPSAESREKMRQAKLGKPSPWKGKTPSKETRLKMSLAKQGQIQTDELKIKNREGQIRRHLRTNPNYVMETRNARIARNGGFHSENEWEKLKAQYNWTCPSCRFSEISITLTKDHIIPLLMGGSNNIENIQPLCGRCNRKKHTQTIRY